MAYKCEKLTKHAQQQHARNTASPTRESGRLAMATRIKCQQKTEAFILPTAPSSNWITSGFAASPHRPSRSFSLFDLARLNGLQLALYADQQG